MHNDKRNLICKHLHEYYSAVRQVGHTTKTINGVDSDTIIIVHNERMGERLKQKYRNRNLFFITLDQIYASNGAILRGLNKPLVIDNAALYLLFSDNTQQPDDLDTNSSDELRDFEVININTIPIWERIATYELYTALLDRCENRKLHYILGSYEITKHLESLPTFRYNSESANGFAYYHKVGDIWESDFIRFELFHHDDHDHKSNVLTLISKEPYSVKRLIINHS